MTQRKKIAPVHDDGRRKMPKCTCPVCGKRIADTSSKELKNAMRIFQDPSGNADFYVECPHCHKILGVNIRLLHTAENLPVPADEPHIFP